MRNFIEIYQLINYLEDFFSKGYKKILDVGEIVGCNLLRYAAEQAASFCGFKNTLFVSGIQDFVYSGNERSNSVYWKNLLVEFTTTSVLNQDTIFNPVLGGRKVDHVYRPNKTILSKYKVMIINQAQYIPYEYLNDICDAFKGYIIRIFDPFDSYCENQMISTICVDTFENLPMTIGYARSLYGVETRSVNKKSKGSVVYEATISRRSIGKIDQNQYVTNDKDLYLSTIGKQENSPFRKGQKLLVRNERILFENCNEYSFMQCISRGTLLHIIQGGRGSTVRCRIHASKAVLDIDAAYKIKPFVTPKYFVQVIPGNVMTVKDAALHYHDKIVYVHSREFPQLSIRDQYTLIKVAQSVVFAETK